MTTRALAIIGRLGGSLAFRASITAALLVLVLSRLDWGLIGDRLSGGEPIYGVLAVLALAGALAAGALRWHLLLRVGEIHLSRRDLLRIYAVSAFANAFLPTSVGGDVARPLMISRRGPALARAIATVVLERVVALFALLLVAWFGLIWIPDAVSDGARTALAVVSLGAVAATIFAVGLATRWASAAEDRLPARAMTSLREAAPVVRAAAADRTTLSVLLVLSLLFQALVTMQLVFLGRLIDVDLPFGLAAVALALVTLATLIPISIGGFGVREGSYVVLLGGGGIEHTDAVLISLLSVVALLIATLPGAVELVRSGFAVAELGEVR